MKLHLKPYAVNALLVAIFLGFLIFGLGFSKWQNSYEQSWYKLPPDFASSGKESIVPYIMELDDVNLDGYPEFLIYDSYEKSIIINSTSAENDPFEIIRNLSESDILRAYSNSSFGLYTLKTPFKLPKFIWWRKLKDSDIIKCIRIPDVDGDGIKDFAVVMGVRRSLPDIDTFGYTKYTEFFADNPWIFEYYFNIRFYNNSVIITPTYKEYIVALFSGSSGQTVERSDLLNITSEDAIVDVVPYFPVKNPEDIPDGGAGMYSGEEYNLTSFSLLMLTVNVSAPQYKILKGKGFFPEELNFGLVSLSIKPMNVTFNLTEQMLINNISSPVGSDEDFGPYENLMFGIDTATFGELRRFGNVTALRFSGSYVKTGSGTNMSAIMSTEQTYKLFSVLDPSIPTVMWNGNVNLTYITNERDINGDGLGEVYAYYNTNDTTVILLLNSTNGDFIAKYEIGNTGNAISADNFAYNRFIVADDDMLGNDGIPEIIVFGFNGRELSKKISSGDLSPYYTGEFLRLNLNATGSEVLYKKITNTGINFVPYLNYNWTVYKLGVDINGDGYNDYLIYQDGDYLHPNKVISLKMIGPLLSDGIQPLSRDFGDIFSLYTNYKGMRIDGRELEDAAVLFTPPDSSGYISALRAGVKGIMYVEDINSYMPSVPFFEYFKGSNIGFIVLIGLAGLLTLIGLTGIRFGKRGEKIEEHVLFEEEYRGLKLFVIVGFLMLLGIVGATIYFFTVSVHLTIGYTDIIISPEGQLVWYILFYPAIFGFMAFIPPLYSRLSPIVAEYMYIRGQRNFYKFMEKFSKKDYRVIVVDIREKRRVSVITRISRTMLPLLISITIGITIYKGVGPDGFITQMMNFEVPLSQPDKLGVLTPDMTDARDLWNEMGAFARFCVLPMLITYVVLGFLIPGAWLLDDAGVCYYEEPLEHRSISDVDSISRWTLNFVSGIFGFTAVISFFNLFAPMFARVDDLLHLLVVLSDIPPALGLIVIVMALVVFPIFSGVLLIYSAAKEMERSFDINSKRLYERMEKMGIDTRPRNLRAVLDAVVTETDRSKKATEDENKQLPERNP